MLSAIMQEIMRSFTSCQATDMEWLFWFSLLLAYLPLTRSLRKTESCLTQPDRVIWRKNGQSVVLTCKVIQHCSDKGFRYEWFSFNETSHHRLKLLEDPQKYRLVGASLHINSLHVNDSGIYHCAAVTHGDSAPDTQYIGLGTTLVVKEKAKIMVRNILLWVSFVLLTIYSLALVTLIVKKYHCRRVRKFDKRNSTKKKQFSDVLQEMYRKRNLDKGKANMRANHPQAEAASSDHSSNDDIYQNV